MADRGHHARPGAGHARARPAGQAAVLARRHAGAPAELGRAIGAACRELAAAGEQEAARRLEQAGLDELAARNLIRYLAEQRAATGYVPDDRTLVVERFRDELGDWRVVLHSPYGDRVHAPWALAIAARLRERYGGMDVQALHTDDGIIIRVPDSDEPPPTGIALIDPDDIGDLVTAEVGASALFASRFRECASRALLLPRRQPGRRTPLWQQRQRSAQLLEVASQYPAFPIVLETVRECLRDVFDVPALTTLLRDIAARRVRVVEVETQTPSPFGKSLLFRYVGAFMYEGDAPLAERRAQALSLDPALLAELLGQDGLRELLDPAVIAETERDLQHLSAEPPLPGPGGRRRPAAHGRPADRRRGGRAVRRPGGGARLAGRAVGGPADHPGAGSRGSRCGPRSRTRDGCGTRSGYRCRSACPRRSPSRSRTRSVTWWPGTPGRTARSPPTRRRSGTGSAWPW